MRQFHVGQCWTYKTRAGEESSRIIVTGQDDIANFGSVFHVAVINLNAGPETPPAERDKGDLGGAAKDFTEAMNLRPDVAAPAYNESGWKSERASNTPAGGANCAGFLLSAGDSLSPASPARPYTVENLRREHSGGSCSTASLRRGHHPVSRPGGHRRFRTGLRRWRVEGHECPGR